jgi:hypothetical protein
MRPIASGDTSVRAPAPVEFGLAQNPSSRSRLVGQAQILGVMGDADTPACQRREAGTS